MSGLLIGALTSGVLGAGKAIFGGVQAARGRKEMKNLLANRPQYNIPEAYMKSLGIYQNLAAGEMPGMQRYEQMIGESTSRAMTGAERGAISSNVYQGAVSSAQDRELQALQQLAQMGVQYKTQTMQNLAGAQTQMGQLQDQAFEYNVNVPWNIRANMAQSKIQAGGENLYGGLGDIASTAMNFAGTKYYVDAMSALQQQPNNPNSMNRSIMPPPNYSPQQNLMNTAGGLLKKNPINYPDF